MLCDQWLSCNHASSHLVLGPQETSLWERRAGHNQHIRITARNVALHAVLYILSPCLLSFKFKAVFLGTFKCRTCNKPPIILCDVTSSNNMPVSYEVVCVKVFIVRQQRVLKYVRHSFVYPSLRRGMWHYTRQTHISLIIVLQVYINMIQRDIEIRRTTM